MLKWFRALREEHEFICNCVIFLIQTQIFAILGAALAHYDQLHQVAWEVFFGVNMVGWMFFMIIFWTMKLDK
jgi:hypothetical protein